MKTKSSGYQLIICLVVCMSVLFSPLLHAVGWYDEFNSTYPDDLPTRPYLAWYESYVIRAYISMYRASVVRGEPDNEQWQWLDRIVHHCDYIVDSDLTGEEYLVWAGHGYTPIARFVKLVFKDDNLYAEYTDEVNRYLHYIESEIIPHWREYAYWETPHNWYLSYGSLLMNLHQITRLRYYEPDYYETPDTSLADYYYNTVAEMADDYFQDFGDWEYEGEEWSNDPYPLKAGLCFYDRLNAYAWRYYDYIGSLYFWGYIGEREGQSVESSSPLELNRWYQIVILYGDDTLTMRVYDSDGETLLIERSTRWENTPTEADLIIGKRVDSDGFFVGIMDELRIEQDGELIAWWQMEGNAVDSSGNEHDGEIRGDPEWVDGRVGQAMQFDGDDYIVIPHHEDLDNFTRIELWLQFSELDSRRYVIFGKGEHFHYGPGGYHCFMSCYKRPEDVGHANLDIEFVVKASHDELFSQFYPEEMLQRFCNAFTGYIWCNEDATHPVFQSHVDPSGEYGDQSGGHTIRWLWLYEFEPEIGNLVSNWYEDHDDAWLTEALANLACWQEGLFIDEYDSSLAVREWDQGSNTGFVPSFQVFPSPFNFEATVRYCMPIPGHVTLKIYDVTGRLVRTLIDEPRKIGYHTAVWDARNNQREGVANGIYFIKLHISEPFLFIPFPSGNFHLLAA